MFTTIKTKKGYMLTIDEYGEYKPVEVEYTPRTAFPSYRVYPIKSLECEETIQLNIGTDDYHAFQALNELIIVKPNKKQFFGHFHRYNGGGFLHARTTLSTELIGASGSNIQCVGSLKLIKFDAMQDVYDRTHTFSSRLSNGVFKRLQPREDLYNFLTCYIPLFLGSYIFLC